MVEEAKVIKVEPISTEVAIRAQQEAPAMLKQAEAVVIMNQSQYEGANNVLKAVKDKYKDLDTKRKDITKPLDLAKRGLMDLFRTPLEILSKAESIIKRAMISYADEQDRLRREEQRKLELKAKAEEDRKRKDLEDRAKKWADKGKAEKADELLDQAEDVHVDAQVVASNTEQPKGVSYQEIWKFKIIDVNKIPREYMMPDEIKLRKMANAMKGAIPVAGIEFYSEKILKSRNNA